MFLQAVPKLYTHIFSIWMRFSTSRFKWRRSETQRSTLALYWSEQSQNTFRRHTTSHLGAQLKTFLRSWLSVQENFWRFGRFSSTSQLIDFCTAQRSNQYWYEMKCDNWHNGTLSWTKALLRLEVWTNRLSASQMSMFWTAWYSCDFSVMVSHAISNRGAQTTTYSIQVLIYLLWAS